MKIIDMHSDTFYRMKECSVKQDILKNGLHVDMEKLRQGSSLIQCFALYTDVDEQKEKGLSPWSYLLDLYAFIREEVKKTEGAFTFVRNISEAVTAVKSGQLAGMLTVEDLGVIGEDIDKIDVLHKMGVCMMSLTWDYSNALGHPNLDATREKGLTPLGHDAIDKMRELGIMIDVSHLSDRGFWDIYERMDRPFVASHSNARSVFDHRRNLTDDMIRALGEKGGVVGLNFCPMFLTGERKELRVRDLVEHTRHFINKGGLEVAAIGTDFDGMGGDLEIHHFGEMGKLVDGFSKAGFTSDEIEKICFKNAERVFEDILG